MNTKKNIASICVAASANEGIVIPTDNTIETFKFNISEMEEGLRNYCLANGEEFMAIAKSKVSKEFTLYLNGREYTCSIDKSELSGKYRLYMWDAQTLETIYKAHFDFKVMSGLNVNNTVAEMEKAIIAAANFTDDEITEQQTEQMQEIVAEAQDTIDHLVMDLTSVAPSFNHLQVGGSKIDFVAAQKIINKITEICNQCLIDCGKVCGCYMVADDGFFPCMDELKKWCCGFDWMDMDDTLADHLMMLDYPLGLEDEDDIYRYPHYLWDELRDYALVAGHYTYCA